MNNPFVFLVIPVAIVAVASLFLWLRGRNPTTLRSGVESFNREMQALSPDADRPTPRRFEAQPGSRTTPTDQDG